MGRQAEGRRSEDTRISSAKLEGQGKPCIEVREATFRFNEKVMLDGFSLTVYEGEKVALKGPSGRGKTTVLRSILGFVVPTKGSIRIMGQQVDANSIWHLRTLIGYVPQEPELGNGTVRAWLERPFTFKVNRDVKHNLDKIPELFRLLLLPLDLLDKDVQVLSGGEKQRIAIISALLLERPILLMDEPTSALDDMSKRRLAEFLSTRNNLTVLVVSHDPTVISIADRVVTLN